MKVKSISLQMPKNEPTNRKVDHIVYVVSDLDGAIKEFERKLGIRPIFGGYHKSFGTKNALVNLNNQTYLELLAADNSNTNIKAPRWMGVDLLTKNQITRWALKSNFLQRDAAVIKAYNSQMGEIKDGSRNSADGSLLQWKLSMPLSAPEVELVPFLLDWSNTAKHPSELLPPMNCKLIELYATHPNPDAFNEVFKLLGYSFSIRPSSEISIKAVIGCPKGLITV